MPLPSETPGRLQAGDFKSMLATPRRPVSASELFAKKPAGGGGAAAAKPAAPKKAKKKQDPDAAMAAARRAERYKKKEAEAVKYRNRAEERLRGVNPDYKHDEAIQREAGMTPMAARVGGMEYMTPAAAHQTPFMQLQQQPDFRGIKMKQGAVANPEAEEEGTPEETAAQRQQAIYDDMEKSKFLGGDEEHTHLVRGLDFELYRKTRAALEAKKAAAAAAAAMPPPPAPTPADKASALLARIAADKKDVDVKKAPAPPPPAAPAAPAAPEQPAAFATSLGASVFNVLAPKESAWNRGKDGRRGKGAGLFVIDMSPHAGVHSIPTTKAQPASKFAATPALATVEVDVPAALLAALKGITLRRDEGAYGGMKQKKQREKDRRARDQLVRKESARLHAQVEKEALVMVRPPVAAAAASPATAPPARGAKVDAAADDDDDSFELFPGVGGMEMEIGTPERQEPDDPGAKRRHVEAPMPPPPPRGGRPPPRAAADDEAFDAVRELLGEAPPLPPGPSPPAHLATQAAGAPPPRPVGALKAKKKKMVGDYSDEYTEIFPSSWAGPDRHGFAAGLDEGDDDLLPEREEQGDKDAQKASQQRKMKVEHEFKQFLKQHEQLDRKRKEADGGPAAEEFKPKRQKFSGGDPFH